MKKYWVIFKNASVGQITNPTMMVMRLAFLAMLVITTQMLWQAIGHEGFDPVNIVWYLVMNELLLFSWDDRMQKKILYDIRSGNVGYSLIRPFSYLGQNIIEGMGVFCARLPILMIGGIGLAFALTGGLPTTFYGILAIFFLMFLSGMLANICLVSIGLLGLYMQNPQSVYWIWQKFIFVLGGLFFPLTIYPDWLNTLAHWTPFPYMLYGVSRLIFEFSLPIVFDTAFHLLGWIAIFYLIAKWQYKALLKKVSVNGG
jgi:ABC-2 type transport system permease protein